ncbi:DUF1194 domain-containing protein [Kiloniella sp. EL199]|uniref:DUF1194 domain-containing protein n=1 Tax=Kiloniella sp. EL199 TaxID=2107581 RepID=UPI000EA2FFAC|nr:DUF1194 domain-containing protein [Kiloniella sp. EL199]
MARVTIKNFRHLLGISVSLFLNSSLCTKTNYATELSPVDLELVLAVDVSHSVDKYEASLQRSGYVEALKDSEVINSISSGPLGRIAVTYIEWAGEQHQIKVVEWSILDSRESAEIFADKLTRRPISSAPSTSISRIIDVASFEINHNDFIAPRSVIDISGDGPNSDGRHVQLARNDAINQGITINGLPVLSFRPNPNGLGAPSAWLGAYYLKNVIGGENAFLIEVLGFEAFSEILKEKLKREIKGTSEIAFNKPQVLKEGGRTY